MEPVKENAADDERQSLSRSEAQDLEAQYKQIGITAVMAAANYVKQSKPRRAA